MSAREPLPPGLTPAAVERFGELLRLARRIAILTGAGISTESGIPDFRSGTGVYATRASESIFDIEQFRHDPRPFFQFARTFFAEVAAAQPNAGHLAIAALEKWEGKEVDVATQNIDVLHQRAGTRRLHAVHGTLDSATCTGCGDQVAAAAVWATVTSGGVPWHGCGGVYKPDIVFFGEMLPEAVLWRARHAFETADVAIVLGTSLTVYPAAALPEFRRRGVPLVIVNRTATQLDTQAALVFRESIGTVMPAALAAASARAEERSP
jgi:NAD-dependent deacetylase